MRSAQTSCLHVLIVITAVCGWAASPSAAPPPPVEDVERITLQAAVQRALRRNPTVAVALAEIRRAEGLLRQARSTSLPTLTSNVGYTRLDGDRVLNGNVIAGADQVNANLLLTVPVLVPQRWVQWSHAADNVEVARVSAEEARRQIAIATARAYLSVLAQHRFIAANEQARDNARAHLQFAHSRFAGGIGTRIDEVRAAQELATDEANLHNASASLVRAREALGVLVAAEGPLDNADDAPLAQGPPLEAALTESTQRRQDVQAYASRERAAGRVEKFSWVDYLPYLVGTFQPFYQNPPTLTVPEWGWQANLLLTVPLYDGGFRYGASRERKALHDEARAGLDGVLRQARSDVRAAYESSRRAEEALTSAREAARLAAEAMRLANLAYRAGATTNLEVIDAERRARDADLTATIAEDAARQARLDLLIASGRFPGT